MKIIFSIFFVLLIAGCAGKNFDEKSPIYISDNEVIQSTSDFDKDITYKTIRYYALDKKFKEDDLGKAFLRGLTMSPMNTQEKIFFFLRAWKRKKGTETSYQIYFTKPYEDSDWRFYKSANLRDGSYHELVIIDRSVERCKRGICKYTEELGLAVSKELLLSNSSPINEYLDVRLNSKSGHKQVFGIPKKLIHGFLIATGDLPQDSEEAGMDTVNYKQQ